MMTIRRFVMAGLLVAAPAAAQEATNFPFDRPINATDDIIVVDVVEFATVPNFGMNPPRLMTMVDEPGTGRLFVSDMNGIVYSVSYDGRTVRPYLDMTSGPWASVRVQAQGNERGLQSFAFHPQFNQQGSRGYGKFYTWLDTQDNMTTPDYQPGGGTNTHHTVLLEWTARNPAAESYDGGAPREILRFEQPFANHNGGDLRFRPNAAPGDADFGLIYLGNADGGSGGDPLNNSQKLSSPYGKILRIDPLGTNGKNGKYGIPADNPFVGRQDTLGEIYALGVRNPQRFGWDPRNNNMFLADIGQNVIEELSPVPKGGNLGWNLWEGSFRFLNRQVITANPRSDPSMTYPIVEYQQPFPLQEGGTATSQPLLGGQSAATGVHVFRNAGIPQLEGKLVFGDQPRGEIFYVDADRLPEGGQDPIRRIMLRHQGQTKTLFQLVQEKNTQLGMQPATRVDMRFGYGRNGQLYLINKRDGVIRRMVAGN